MTKSQLVDAVAARTGLTRKQAAEAIDAVLETVEDVLSRGGEVTLAGFGKFSVAERAARQGDAPAHGRGDGHRRHARAEVHRRLEPQAGRPHGERGGSRSCRVTAFGDRLAELVAARESQIVLGLDPDPARLWPDAVAAGARRRLAGAARGGRRAARTAPR